ncbi:MAG: PEP-utilizing enzyme [Actinomycetota bacterium]
MFPGPVMPLDADLLLHRIAGPAWRAELIGRLGFRPDELPPSAPPVIAVIDGYAYLNASLLRVWAHRTPVLAANHIDAAYLGPGLPAHQVMGWHDHPAATGGSLHQWLRRLLVEGDLGDVDELWAEARRLQNERPDIATLLDTEVHRRIADLAPLLARVLARQLHIMLAASIGPGILSAICVERGLPTEAVHLIAGLGGVPTAAPVPALWTLSRLAAHSATAADAFNLGPAGLEGRLRASGAGDVRGLIAGVDALAAEVGALGAGTWELTAPSDAGVTGAVLAAVDRLRRLPDTLDPAPAMAAVAANRAELVTEFDDTLDTERDVEERAARNQFLVAVRATESVVRARERISLALGLVLDEMRVAVRELGLRATARNDVSHPDDLRLLNADEFAYYADGGLADVGAIVSARRIALAERRRTPPPVVDVETGAGRTIRPATDADAASPMPLEAGGIVMGWPVASAVGRGRARIVTDLTAGPPADLEPGEVLVASTIPTSWLPYLIGIGGVVTEAGSLLSHLSVLCRELSVPLVAGIEHATGVFVEGSVLSVDGLTGIVSVMEDPPVETASEAVMILDPWGVS